MKDLFSKITLLTMLGVAVRTATSVSAALTLKGYNSAVIGLQLGVGGITFTGANNIDVRIEHSDNGTTWLPVAEGDIIGVASVGAGGSIKLIATAHAVAANYRFGYKGGKEFVRGSLVFNGTHGVGTPCGLTLILGNGELNPQKPQA